jgi:F-box-like
MDLQSLEIQECLSSITGRDQGVEQKGTSYAQRAYNNHLLSLSGLISPPTTIEALPDDVLLDIFDFYREALMLNPGKWAREWHKLVHVCQRWRCIVFASPRRLMLHIICTVRTPVRAMLDIWPPLPIEIEVSWSGQDAPEHNNVIAALEHRDRICKIVAYLTRSEYSRFVTAMQERFPALTALYLSSLETLPELPDTFLSGSAPLLQTLFLYGIPFPTLPKLLSSTNGLVDLRLDRIPDTGFISSDVMATALSALTSLRSLFINFESFTSLPDQRCPPPPTPAVLPSLIGFWFGGGNKYLEDLVARIDAPLLQIIDILLPDNPIFGFQHLHRFISHSAIPISFDDVLTFSHVPAVTWLGYPSFSLAQGGIGFMRLCAEP